MTNNILCVIPARSGSKGIPNKNIYMLNEVPLIAYSIFYAKKFKSNMDIIVSTNSIEIKDISETYGAQVPFLRPEELASDDTPDYPVCLHALNTSENVFNKKYDFVIWIRPTSPARPEGLIEKGLGILNHDKSIDSVRSVSKSKQHPFRQFYIDKNKLLPVENNINDAYNTPRQFLPAAYFQTGHLEIIRSKIIKNGNISGKNIAPLFIDNKYMFDLDTPEDMDELKYAIEKNPNLLANIS